MSQVHIACHNHHISFLHFIFHNRVFIGIFQYGLHVVPFRFIIFLNEAPVPAVPVKIANQSIYENPLNAAPLLVSYGIDYIEVSSWERADYAVDEAALSSLYPCIFDNGEIQIYQVTR